MTSNSGSDDLDAIILVCQSGTCRQSGSAAVLIEIEELAKSVGGCRVNASGCLGLCSRAPGAAILISDDIEYHPSIITPQKSAHVVEKATGRRPDLEDPELELRLFASRIMRRVVEGQMEFKWNNVSSALKSLTKIARDEEAKQQARLDLADCFEKAGRFEEALDALSSSSVQNNFQRMTMRSKLEAQVGNQQAALEVINDFKKRTIEVMATLVEDNSSGPEIEEMLRIRSRDLTAADKTIRFVKTIHYVEPENRPVANYYPWSLTHIQQLSEVSAIYSFTCFGVSRRRPAEKRSFSGKIWCSVREGPCLWHTTLLSPAPTGTEGPMPWVERDYTPVSTFSDWVLGKCDLLIKEYPGGRATQWLKRQDVGALVRLSEPKLTDSAAVAPVLAKPSLLLVAGGTGVAVALQILAALAESPKAVGVLYSCRANDAAALDALEALAVQRAATPGRSAAPVTYMQVILTGSVDPVAEVARLATRYPSARFAGGHIDRQAVAQALSSITNPYAAAACNGEAQSGSSCSIDGAGAASMAAEVGVLVSGPSGMNAKVRIMLDDLCIPPDAAAILQA